MGETNCDESKIPKKQKNRLPKRDKDIDAMIMKNMIVKAKAKKKN